MIGLYFVGAGFARKAAIQGFKNSRRTYRVYKRTKSIRGVWRQGKRWTKGCNRSWSHRRWACPDVALGMSDDWDHPSGSWAGSGVT